MKTIILLLLLCLTAGAYAQGGGIAVKKTASTHLYTLPFPHDTTLFLRGDSSWTSVANLSLPYFQNDATAPVTAPVVSADTRSFGAGDSLIVTGINSIGFGTRTRVLANQAIGLGSIEDGNGSAALLINGKGAIGIGASVEADGFAGICIGWSAIDLQTSQVNDGSHGNNIVIGNSAFTGGQANNSVAIGTSSECDSNDDVAIGHNAVAVGHHTVLIGENSGASVNKNYQVNIGSFINGNPTSAFDSTTQLGAGVTTARNADEFVYGNSNATGSSLLFQFSDGARHGNGAGFDVLKGNFDGTVTVGKAISIPGGTANQFLQTDGSGTNTWASQSQFLLGSIGGAAVSDGKFYTLSEPSGTGFVSDPTDTNNSDACVILPAGHLKNLRLTVTNAPQGGAETDSIVIIQNKTVTSYGVKVTAGTHTAINTGTLTINDNDRVAIKVISSAESSAFSWYIEFVKP